MQLFLCFNRYLLACAVLGMVFSACSERAAKPKTTAVDWSERSLVQLPNDSLTEGSTYLAVYSEIYSITEKRTHHLTVTVSMRNTSATDSVFVLRADHYNTAGELVRSYFDGPVFIRPLETVEIVIGEGDTDGGTGGNFIFDWQMRSEGSKPLFEAIMISTSGSQGLSFTSQGVER